MLAVLDPTDEKELGAAHILIMVLAITIVFATAFYGLYYCRYYRVMTKSLLVVDDSPLETPNGSPFHERRRPIVTSTGSTLTLTEVLSLKSLKFGIRKGPARASSYTRLARTEDFKKGVLRSFSSSPQVPTLGILGLRRSSSQWRFLRRGNAYQRQKNRRSASFDQLRTSCVSPIMEDKTMPNSFTMEDITKKAESKAYIEVDDKLQEAEDAERGEDHSSKYKEHRKSLLATENLVEKLKQSELEPTKLSKERVNRVRASLERLRRDAENTVKASSSVSEISMTGAEMELEYDYYDYDVGNASAAPGSLFGMDPTLVPWMIDIDDLDIKSADQLASQRPEDADSASRRLSLSSTPTPPVNQRSRPEEIPLNILPVTDLLQRSSTSTDSNENNDRTPTRESFRGSPERTSASAKILNIHDVDDDEFQFADESDDED